MPRVDPNEADFKALAALLARALLRLAESSRPSAVSATEESHDSLDVSALSRPDERVVRDVRRVG